MGGVTRFAWLIWLKDNFGQYGYSHGPVHGSIGTFAVLVTAVLIRIALHRQKSAVTLTAAGLVGVAGVGWLAC